MQRVVAFYEKLPRGPAPAAQPKGLIQRYQHRYTSGKNPRAMRKFSTWYASEWRTTDTDCGLALAHLVGGLILIGYAQNYYFHLRKWLLEWDFPMVANSFTGHHKNNAH
jgi:hypothetical protein